ncbi:MAG: hypothetical protein EA398_09185 [Deltaproteobacteria bacterium]|nr:MAG: hypothetical protein EA398_09185 [Deltaproteobacteria bacterium]
MNPETLDDAIDRYREDRDRTMQQAAARDTVSLQDRAADARHRARALRRLWRWQRHGRTVLPALAALALGLHLWATRLVDHTAEEHALATLLLLHEPAASMDDPWEDWLALHPEDEENSP